MTGQAYFFQDNLAARIISLPCRSEPCPATGQAYFFRDNLAAKIISLPRRSEPCPAIGQAYFFRDNLAAKIISLPRRSEPCPATGQAYFFRDNLAARIISLPCRSEPCPVDGQASVRVCPPTVWRHVASSRPAARGFFSASGTFHASRWKSLLAQWRSPAPARTFPAPCAPPPGSGPKSPRQLRVSRERRSPSGARNFPGPWKLPARRRTIRDAGHVFLPAI
jgi:hypothetical protein